MSWQILSFITIKCGLQVYTDFIMYFMVAKRLKFKINSIYQSYDECVLKVSFE